MMQYAQPWLKPIKYCYKFWVTFLIKIIWTFRELDHQTVKDLGYISVLSFKIGNMSGDRVGAHWNSQDFTLMILQACVGLGLAPIVDWEMEMTPVDFAAEFIVRMTYNLSLSLGKTFHVVNDKPLQSRWCFAF